VNRQIGLAVAIEIQRFASWRPYWKRSRGNGLLFLLFWFPDS